MNAELTDTWGNNFVRSTYLITPLTQFWLSGATKKALVSVLVKVQSHSREPSNWSCIFAYSNYRSLNCTRIAKVITHSMVVKAPATFGVQHVFTHGAFGQLA